MFTSYEIKTMLWKNFILTFYYSSFERMSFSITLNSYFVLTFIIVLFLIAKTTNLLTSNTYFLTS